MNIRQQAFLLLAIVADIVALVVFAIVWLLTNWWIALIVGLIVWAVVVAGVYLRREQLAVAGMAPRQLDPSDNPHVPNLLDVLVTAHGFERPEMQLLNCSGANACVVGADNKSSKIVLTTGLTDRLERLEIEGMLAHLLTVASNTDLGGSTLAAAVLSILPSAGLKRKAIEWMYPEHFRLDADLDAVGYTRYPPGFLSGLEKLRASETTVPMARTSNAHLWLADPIGDPSVVTERIHPPIDLRISVLREL